MYKRIVLLLAILFAPLAVPLTVQAQVGTTTDILTGRVTDTSGKPMANVEVVAQSGETGISRKKRTDNDGRYTIVFPDGGGQYRLTVRAIGFQPVSRNIARQADQDRLITDVQFGKAVAALTPVNVTAGRTGGRNRGDRPGPGESGRTLGADQIARLPVDASDLAAIASLAPGVIPIAGTDSTAAAFSVAGQRSTLNNVTLDGLSIGSFSVPQEGLRSTRVVTNTFDPSRGQFSGGLVASTTRSGTNELTGGFTYSRRDPTLEYSGNDSAVLSPLYLQDQISAGLGGPIIKDKLFVFGSAQFRRLSNPFQSLLAASPGALSSIGIQADSANQFINAVNGYGVPLNSSLVPARRIGDNAVGLLRLDYFVSDGTTLTLRADYRHQSQDPTRSSPLALPTLSGTSATTGSGLAAILTSAFQNGLINQFSSYVSASTNHADPFLALPAGRVRVTSILAGATQGISVLGFGGNPSLPQQGDDGLLELSDELSYLTHDRTHRIKLGGLLDVSRFNQDLTSNRIGTFTFNSLQDFVDNVPASYTRTLGSLQVHGSSTSGAIYLGDTWQPRQGAQVVYGLRAEGTQVGDAPPLNPAIQQQFGLRTDEFPSELHVSPRVGFSLNLTKPDTTDPFAQFLPPFLIRGGIGEFRAKTPTGLFTSAQQATGLANTEQQVVCIGAAVPTPDWTAYEADPTTIPTQCAQANSTPPDLGAIQNNVTLFDPTFKAPRAWRSSLGVQRRLFGTITASADASYARGVALYGVTDLNLNTTPAFSLSQEGNRPVYVPSSAIVSTTGAVSPTASRQYPQYGDVFELSSNLKSETRQLLLSLNGATANGTVFNLSYTLSNTRDQSTFTCCSAMQGFASPTTAGNPNVLGWAPGDLDVRHIFQGTVTKTVTSSLDLTGIARLSSGQPFTPLVGGDINGDGVRNDRAFIFDPKSVADPAVAAAMQQLIANAPARVRDCLNEQLGAVAGRNSCRGPWTPSLDIQANFRPEGFGLHRSMMFSLITSNLLAGVDQLLHGGNLHGWGQPNRVDQTLLYVRGFDASTQNFVYDVNERFGSTNLAQSAFRVPFVVALQARLMLGPDPRDRFRQIFSSRLQSATDGAGAVLNPIAQIIQMRIQLQLTQDQVDRLTVVSDSLAKKTQLLSDSIRALVAKRGGGGDPRAIMTMIRPQIVEGRKNMAAALAQAQGILNKEQWGEVPDSIKKPPRGLGGDAGAGGGGRRGGGRNF